VSVIHRREQHRWTPSRDHRPLTIDYRRSLCGQRTTREITRYHPAAGAARGRRGENVFRVCSTVDEMARRGAQLTFDRTKEIRDDHTSINLIVLFVAFRFSRAHWREGGEESRILCFSDARILLRLEFVTRYFHRSINSARE